VDHTSVVGLQWGDEGKGKIVDVLTHQYDVVARYNGGANAGHTVEVGNQRYALHLIPSGILSREKLNVIGNGVVVDPRQLLGEIDELRERGVWIGGNLRVSDRAHVVFPYHKLQDRLLEAALARSRGEGGRIGTTGRGIGPCYGDKALRSTAVRMGELLDADLLREKLRHVVAIKNVMLGALAGGCDEAFEPIDAETLCEEYLGYGQRLRPHIADTAQLLHEVMAEGRRILFEGANATLLDVDHGTYPFVTSSNCSSLGIFPGTGVPGRTVTRVIGIVKAYCTRVGGGPMPTEQANETGDRIREAGREYGTTTGRPRRCGWLDLVSLRYSAMLNGATGIALTLLDVLAGFEVLKVCVGYRHRGEPLKGFPADAGVLEAVEPIYERLPGFTGSIRGCQQFEDLPEPARGYVRVIEDHIGVPVRMISVGPRRDQTIVR